jgi:hypothetical protein
MRMRDSTAKVDVAKVRRALAIRSVSESVPALGGGVALIVLGYPLWGLACVVAAGLEILSKVSENRAPRPSRAMSAAVSALQAGTLLAGGAVLLSSGQVAGGIACLAACLVKATADAILMPWVERRYLRPVRS